MIEFFRTKGEKDSEPILMQHPNLIKDSIAVTKEEPSSSASETPREIRPTPYQGPSFEHIIACDSNGAIVHYEPFLHKLKEGRSDCLLKNISENSMILIDTGGQYLGGTTDVTRTIHLGTPTEAQRHAFTSVLRGHVDLFLSRFALTKTVPREHESAEDTAIAEEEAERAMFGVQARQLDLTARLPSMQLGVQYGHGTGHGVGNFLCVHEDGVSLSMYSPLLPRTTVTNEPGLYLAGRFGVRTESLALVQEDCGTLPDFFGCSDLMELDRPESAEPAAPMDKVTTFYGLESVTLVPYQRSLIDPSMLTIYEKKWINAFNRRCRRVLIPFLNEEEKAWLLAETEEL